VKQDFALPLCYLSSEKYLKEICIDFEIHINAKFYNSRLSSNSVISTSATNIHIHHLDIINNMKFKQYKQGVAYSGKFTSSFLDMYPFRTVG